MIDTMRTILVAADEYEMRYGKRPTLFINKSFYRAIMANRELFRDGLYSGVDIMSLYGYPVKLVYDDSNEMHFWVGEQRSVYAKGDYYD